MEYPALTKCFLSAVERHANARAQLYRRDGRWEGIAAGEMLRRVAGLAKTLAELGIRRGDRVCIFAANCPEWHTADFAIQGLGGVTVPIYFNESLERAKYILEDSGARVVVTSGEGPARKIAELHPSVPTIEHIISSSAPKDLASEFLRYEALVEAAGDADIARYRLWCGAVSSEQLATIIYTSGTTGEPKGVMLSHANLSSNALDGLRDYAFVPSDLALSFLPLSHAYERMMTYGYLFNGVTVAYVEQMETVAQALLEVHPTIAAAVPRFYEKMYSNIVEKGHRETGLKRTIFDWARSVAEKAVPWKAYGKSVSPLVRWQWSIADQIVYSKIREGVGGRIRTFPSGGAPLAKELAEFFWSVGLPIYQGYGLTETSPIVAANLPSANKVGTVGRPIPNVELRIAEDGEILVKGPCVMQGYYRKPDETNAVINADGWFSTGDIGKIDGDGYLTITDRKKEFLKTAGGKMVAPALVENLLRTSSLIANALLVGDTRKFVSALVVPNFAAVEAEARKTERVFTTPAQMIFDPWVRDLIAQEIEKATAPLAQYEKPKRFALLADDFSYAKGELTYTLKPKRRVIEDHYKDVIAKLYADLEEPRPQHHGNAEQGRR
jgi:long-chain acyl-CoA synthetase